MKVRLPFPHLRRSLLLALLAALSSVPVSAAAFQPIQRNFGELTFPRVRAGTVTIPKGQSSGRIRVIATLKLPPLAQAYGRGLYAAGSANRLNVHSSASKAYLARIEAEQTAAIAKLRQAIPSARISWRYQVILNGMTVSIPAQKLPQLSRQSYIGRVWPSLTYHLSLNRSPGIIGADVFHNATGLNGEGVKIAIVDDGIDNTNPFLGGAGFTPPAGFPMGDTRYTNGKIIVAKAFPGPGSGNAGKLPLDRNASFHGTHVAGIAAGNAGTCAPAGQDHPATCGLTGVAPKAFLGNYRIFNVPTPVGNVAESPEMAVAFEQTVKDGMDILNCSCGGPESEPVNDILITAVNNVAAAGVVPVLSAGNDRDDFGFGTTGSPGTAADGISVAAVTNDQTFTPGLTAFNSAGQQVLHIPIVIGATPAAWETTNQLVVDVGSIIGRNGQPVDRHLCGTDGDPNSADNQLPANSLNGAFALVSRGSCTFFSKGERAAQAGAIGIILVDNRAGEANGIPIQLSLPAGMIADIDGAALRAAMGSSGRVFARISRTIEDIATNRGGVVTSFSSAGPTPFGHLLKPDVAAPGEDILSSTLPENAGSPFAVFDGTSMAAPHVAGAVALLVQRHPTWSPQQVKSALMSSAGAAWGNTERTKEAAVTLEGAGLINIPRADDPQIFTNPASLSYSSLDVTAGAVTRTIIVHITDAGGGSGNWSATIQSQTATPGASISAPATVALAPGGSVDLPVTAQVAADAVPGDDMGFVVLTKGTVTRRVPFYFEATKPAFANMQAADLKAVQTNNTVSGQNRVSQYRFPSWPFGPPASYSGPGVNENGAERLYSIQVPPSAINFGVYVEKQSANSEIDPWVLGSKDENDVQGLAGTPMNVNSLMYDFRSDSEAAGAAYPLPKRYYVAVDAGSNPFTGASLPGTYVLRTWTNDLKPPTLELVTKRVAAGRPTIVMTAKDAKSGVDALSLVLNYNTSVLLGAAGYDPATGLVLFPIPASAPAMKAGAKKQAVLIGSDYQETKNVNPPGGNVMPNTKFQSVKIDVVTTPTVDWLVPAKNACLRKTTRLATVAASTKKLKKVTYFVGNRNIGSKKADAAGISFKDWNPKSAKKGKHVLRAVAQDVAGRTITQSRTVRVCK